MEDGESGVEDVYMAESRWASFGRVLSGLLVYTEKLERQDMRMGSEEGHTPPEFTRAPADLRRLPEIALQGSTNRCPIRLSLHNQSRSHFPPSTPAWRWLSVGDDMKEGRRCPRARPGTDAVRPTFGGRPSGG